MRPLHVGGRTRGNGVEWRRDSHSELALLLQLRIHRDHHHRRGRVPGPVRRRSRPGAGERPRQRTWPAASARRRPSPAATPRPAPPGRRRRRERAAVPGLLDQQCRSSSRRYLVRNLLHVQPRNAMTHPTERLRHARLTMTSFSVALIAPGRSKLPGILGLDPGD